MNTNLFFVCLPPSLEYLDGRTFCWRSIFDQPSASLKRIVFSVALHFARLRSRQDRSCVESKRKDSMAFPPFSRLMCLGLPTFVVVSKSWLRSVVKTEQSVNEFTLPWACRVLIPRRRDFSYRSRRHCKVVPNTVILPVHSYDSQMDDSALLMMRVTASVIQTLHPVLSTFALVSGCFVFVSGIFAGRRRFRKVSKKASLTSFSPTSGTGWRSTQKGGLSPGKSKTEQLASRPKRSF
jgi:hypothetical protein